MKEKAFTLSIHTMSWIYRKINKRYMNLTEKIFTRSVIDRTFFVYCKVKRKSTEFLIDPVYFILSQYADENKLPKFSQCVVCFSHIYSRELSFNRIRDYDNLELKQLLDVIAAFVMEDDTGFLCDTYNTTEIGENDCTRVTVMNKNHFLEWLGEHKIHPENISNF